MFKRFFIVGALALALVLPTIPASAQGGRREAAEAYARIVDYPLLIEQATTRRAAELPASRIHYRRTGDSTGHGIGLSRASANQNLILQSDTVWSEMGQ